MPPSCPYLGVSRHGGIWDPDTTFRAVSNAAGCITVLQPEQHRMMARLPQATERVAEDREGRRSVTLTGKGITFSWEPGTPTGDAQQTNRSIQLGLANETPGTCY